MSAYIYKIIPVTPDGCITKENYNAVLNYLFNRMAAYDINYKKYEEMAFIDCGGYLESISCPYCNKEISFEWWSEKMENVSQNKFNDLSVAIPCCNQTVSLNDLQYYYPCGFSKYEIEIINPKTYIDNTVIHEVIHEVEKILGTKVKIIESRY